MSAVESDPTPSEAPVRRPRGQRPPGGRSPGRRQPGRQSSRRTARGSRGAPAGVRWAARIGIAGVLVGAVVVASQIRPAVTNAAGEVGNPVIAPSPPATSATTSAPDALRSGVPAKRTATDPDPTVTTGTVTGTTTGTTPGGASVLRGGRTVANCLSARGIPSCGAFIGAAIGGNADPASVQSTLGAIALRRTYYQPGQVSKAVSTARADVAAGRVPWISFKVPYSWAEMASGKGDAWARDIAVQLRGVNGPVWIAFHHEPEGDGVMKDWTAMQAHLSPIIRTTAPNVAFTIITTGWNQVFGSNPGYQLDALWPGDGLVDIVAFDSYNEYGVVKNGKTITAFTELADYYAVLSAFAKTHGTHWAIGETGYTDQGAAKDPDWLRRAASDLERMGGVGLAYFDSSLNSQGSWPLDTPAKQAAFRDALSGSIHLK